MFSLAETGFGNYGRRMGKAESNRGKSVGPRSGRVTIDDLAASLGLAKGTVSRALNGYDDISKQTKTKVAAAARELGYRPLGHAQAIRTGRIRSIGLILQTDEHDGYGPFLRDFLAGISQQTSALGWTLTVASATSHSDFEAVAARLVDQRKVDGFILPRTLLNDARYRFLRELGVHSVLFGRVGFGIKGADDGASWFDIDGEQAFAEAVRRLAGFGHRRIGFVGAPEEYNYAHIRRRGYIRGLAEAGLPLDIEIALANVRTRKDGRQATRKLLHLPEPPTAFVFATDETALGAYDAAMDLRLALGRDFSVISYDGAARGGYMMPALTTFRVNLNEAGSRLASFLVRRVEGEPPESLRELTPAKLVEGGTDGPAALSSAELAARVFLAAA